MRKILIGGIVGGLPGVLIAGIPLLLRELDVISSDQSQIGFVGIPVMFIGVMVGVAWGVQRTPHANAAMLGLALGLVAGITAGAALEASSVNVPGLPLLLPVLAMIGGAAFGAWWGEHGAGPPPVTHH